MFATYYTLWVAAECGYGKINKNSLADIPREFSTFFVLKETEQVQQNNDKVARIDQCFLPSAYEFLPEGFAHYIERQT